MELNCVAEYPEMEMNPKIESPKIELTTSSHISTAEFFLMMGDVY